MMSYSTALVCCCCITSAGSKGDIKRSKSVTKVCREWGGGHQHKGSHTSHHERDAVATTEGFQVDRQDAR
jgi:hypothetical protein